MTTVQNLASVPTQCHSEHKFFNIRPRLQDIKRTGALFIHKNESCHHAVCLMADIPFMHKFVISSTRSEIEEKLYICSYLVMIEPKVLHAMRLPNCFVIITF